MVYSEASKSNPHVMLAMPMNAVAAKAMKVDDVKSSAPMSSCAEKNIDTTPEAISRTIRYLRIDASASKMWKRSLRVVSTTKLSTSIVGGSASR